MTSVQSQRLTWGDQRTSFHKLFPDLHMHAMPCVCACVHTHTCVCTRICEKNQNIFKKTHKTPKLIYPKFLTIYQSNEQEPRKRTGSENGSDPWQIAYLQPLLSLLLALDGENQWVCALLGDFQLMFLLLAVSWDVCDAAALQRQLHLRLLVLGTFIALHGTQQTN